MKKNVIALDGCRIHPLRDEMRGEIVSHLVGIYNPGVAGDGRVVCAAFRLPRLLDAMDELLHAFRPVPARGVRLARFLVSSPSMFSNSSSAPRIIGPFLVKIIEFGADLLK